MYKKIVKRFLDIFISLLAMPFVLLLIAIMAPVIWLDDHGPVFYTAIRRGWNQKVLEYISCGRCMLTHLHL